MMKRICFLGSFLAMMCAAVSFAAIAGDLDGSGQVDLQDLLLTLRAETGYADQLNLEADTNGDGIIDLKDTQFILRLIAFGSGGGTVVTFPDPYLENAIRDALSIPAGDITTGDLSLLTSLVAEDNAISNLSGLEYCTSLTYLDLGLFNSSNSISDLSPVSGLTGLKFLDINSNNITDLSAIAGLTGLTHLNFGNNSVSGISPLSGMTALQTLYFTNNQVTGLAPLAGLSALTRIDASYNPFADLSPLTGLTNLSWLNLSYCNIADITALINNTGLGTGDRVDIIANPIPFDNCMNQIPQLEGKGVNVAYIACYRVVTFADPNLEAAVRTAISKPTGDILDTDVLPLTTLSAENNGITDLTGLEYCTNLADLDLGMTGTTNAISDITPLSNLYQLANLDLEDNQLADLLPVGNNSGIGTGDTINVKGNPLNGDSCGTHIPAMTGRGAAVNHDCPTVTVVNFPDPNLESAVRSALGIPTGNITNVDMLNLTTLTAENAGISDLTGMEYATYLTSLDISGNQVLNLLALSSLANLSMLDVRNNEVWTIQGLADNTDFATGDTAYLEGNPLNSDACSTHIPAITARGATVNFICPSGNTITFTDPNLDAAVRSALGIPSPTPLTDTDVLSLYYLGAPDNGISDLSGIENCINLEQLDLGQKGSSNTISNLSYLSSLSRLYQLDIAGNQVVNLSPLAGLTGLTNLDISDNQVTDISALSGLTNLTRLFFSDNQVTDISPISSLTNLENTNFGANLVTDISPVSSLSKLQSVTFKSNQVTDITPLSSMTTLIYVSCLRNQITDISPLSTLSNLKTLYISYNQITDLSPLSTLSTLETLWFRGNQVTTINDLSGLTNLKSLYFGDNLVADLQGLADNTGIATGDIVDVTGNPLNAAACGTQIPVITGRGATVNSDCPGVSVVNFPDSNLEAAVSTTLGVAVGAITTIDMLNLTSLTAENAGITDLTGLENAANLQTLDISDNQVLNLLALTDLAYLTQLDIRNNEVWDLMALVDNTGFATGDTVSMQGNPLSGDSCDTDIPALTGRGATVNHDCPPGNTVTFTDANLEAAVRIALGIPSPTLITDMDMLNLFYLSAKDNSISDLTGLEYATNLEQLELGQDTSSNTISDLTALGSLTRLTYLNIAGNQVTDIGPLAALTSLTFLDFSNNQVTAISALSGLTNLEQLLLYENQVSDIDPLSTLTKLKSLTIRDNQITTITSLSALTDLYYLNISKNTITDISPLFTLNGLIYLYIKWNNISNISVLQGLPNLKDLQLNGNPVTDLTPLVNNLNLDTGDKLYVYNCPLTATPACDTQIPAIELRGVTVYRNTCP